MLRLFRRPPRDSVDPDAEDAGLPIASEELAEGEPGSSTGRRTLRTIVAVGIVAVGLGSLYLSSIGGHGKNLAAPRLLPHGGASQTQPSPTPPLTPPDATSASSVATDGASPSDPSARTTPQAERPTFHAPLSRDPRETAPIVSAPESSAYQVLAQASHEATVENLRSQVAELKLKKLKAELEADELRKNPKRLFREEKGSADLKRESSGLERLGRVPLPSLSIPAPMAAERPAQVSTAQPPAPPAPPQMRVRMVTVEPKEAVIEAGDGDSRGWFTVREGQKFPDFVVTDIGQNGVTISLGGRGYFYPVGGYALGVAEGARHSGQRQTSEPPRR